MYGSLIISDRVCIFLHVKCMPGASADEETPYIGPIDISPTSEVGAEDDDIPVESSGENEPSPMEEEPTPVPRPDPATEPRLDPANVPAASSKAAHPPPPRQGLSAPPHGPRWVQLCMEANARQGRPANRGRG